MRTTKTLSTRYCLAPQQAKAHTSVLYHTVMIAAQHLAALLQQFCSPMTDLPPALQHHDPYDHVER
jgi:hypothetical protein